MKDTENSLAFPACLKPYAKEKRWVVWAWETRKGKPTKPPFKTFGGVRGGYASNDNPNTWASLEDALKALNQDHVCGIGLQLLGLKGFAALDLDNVRTAEGHLIPWAQQLIDRCGSYAEWTPSGNGARILGCVPEGFRSIHTKRNHDKGGEYEIYSNVKTGRYITVSGEQIEGTPSHLGDLRAAIEYLDSLKTKENDDQSNAGQRTLDLGDVPAQVRTYIEHGWSGDRSGDFQSIANTLRPRGWSLDAVLKRLQDNPQGPAGKYIEGNRLEPELRRSWEKAKPPQERPAKTSPPIRLSNSWQCAI